LSDTLLRQKEVEKTAKIVNAMHKILRIIFKLVLHCLLHFRLLRNGTFLLGKSTLSL
jgi:hypothetical protein